MWSFCYVRDVFNNVVLLPKVQVVLYLLCTLKIFVLSCLGDFTCILYSHDY